MAGKKPPSPAQLAAREKFAQAARDRAAKRKAEKEIPQGDMPGVNKEPVEASADNADIGELLRRIQELEAAQNRSYAPSGPQVNPQGSLIGVFEKYITDPHYYPNPTERLALEPRLQRFAFKDNFELDFGVSLSAYETKAGINTEEPKFTLKLVRIVYDDETGERKIVYDDVAKEWREQRFVSCQMIFHEDPSTALIVARENGVKVEEYGEKQFLDEMRYLRMRDWLLECFYPPAPPKVSDRKEMVIGNRLVEVYTVNSEKSESMAPFFADAPKKF